MKKLLIAACVGLLAFSACKDDKEETPAPSQTGSAALTGKDWRMTANTTRITGNSMDTTMDNFADMEDCEKDDLIRFNENKTVTTKSGALKCDPSDPDSEDGGTWELSADSKKLTVTVDGDPETVDVVTLTETSLVISMSGEVSPGITGSTTMTFTKN